MITLWDCDDLGGASGANPGETDCSLALLFEDLKKKKKKGFIYLGFLQSGFGYFLRVRTVIINPIYFVNGRKRSNQENLYQYIIDWFI